jgi:diguanylate cyclase (GGDEF)-like protein
MATTVLLIGVALLVAVLILLTIFGRRGSETARKTMSADILADELKKYRQENARLNVALRRMTSMNNLFFASMIRLTARMNPEEIANATVELLTNQLETDELAVFLYDERSKHLTVSAQCGFDRDSIKKVIYKLGDGKVGLAAEKRLPIGKREFDYSPSAKEPYEIFNPDICYPLLYQERLYGVIAICRDGDLDEREKNMLGIVSTIVAVALNNTRSYEEKSLSASLDPLTKLSNIRFFKERLQDELNRMREVHPKCDECGEVLKKQQISEMKKEYPYYCSRCDKHIHTLIVAELIKKPSNRIAVTILDLDRFKEYNDAEGHQAGDELLIEMAKNLKRYFDDKDEIARYGGDEFIVMSPGIGKQDKAGMVANLLHDLEMSDYGYGHPRRRVTCSAGVAAFPDDGDTVRELIKAADVALYEAKNTGRNTVRVHYPKVKKI